MNIGKVSVDPGELRWVHGWEDVRTKGGARGTDNARRRLRRAPTEAAVYAGWGD